MDRRRTPFAGASNGRVAEADGDGGGNLDGRLLLVRSELSALVNQLDQIFAKAQEHHNMERIAANEDIESLYKLLSAMNSSLEPWVLKLSQAQTTSTPTVQFSNKSLKRLLASTNRDRNSSPSTSDETKDGIMVSPSPLVAWRADGCVPATESQLFLLTPMSKSHESLYRCPCLSNANDTTQLCPLATISRNQDNLPEIAEAFEGRKPCCNGKEKSVSHDPTFFNSSPQDFKKDMRASSIRLSEEGVSNAALSLKNQKFAAPPIWHDWTNKRIDYDDDEEEELEWFLSPPKTCTLMVPDYVSKNPSTVQEKSLRINNPKFPVSMEVAGALSLQGSNKQKLGNLHLRNSTSKRDFNEPLEWFLSPPKTCILMEPSEGKMSPTPSIIADTVLRSRRPGESTLKKELWTKFQDVPMGGFSYKDSASQKVAKKGFMDMLEEALF